MRKLLGVILIGVGAAVGATAQEKAAPSGGRGPTTLATTVPAEVRDSVLAATRAYFEAWVEGDAKRLGPMFDARDERERTLAAAHVRWVGTAAAMRRAAVAKFDEKAAAEICSALPFPDPHTTATRMLDLIKRGGADVQVSGDEASVLKGPMGRVGLRRVGGAWKMSVDVPPEDRTGRDLAGTFERVAIVQEAVARGITDAKYKTAAAAREAFRKGEGLAR